MQSGYSALMASYWRKSGVGPATGDPPIDWQRVGPGAGGQTAAATLEWVNTPSRVKVWAPVTVTQVSWLAAEGSRGKITILLVRVGPTSLRGSFGDSSSTRTAISGPTSA